MSEGFPIRISDVVTADDRRELEDRLNAFNVESTGFRDARDLFGRRLGFSVALPISGGRCDLDDLFVEPDSMGRGVGRLLVADVATRAAAAGASHVDVIANPNALGFYERLGFEITGRASTRFGDAPRMSLELRS